MKEIKIVAEIAYKGTIVFFLAFPLFALVIAAEIAEGMTQLKTLFDGMADAVGRVTSNLWLDVEELKELL